MRLHSDDLLPSPPAGAPSAASPSSAPLFCDRTLKPDPTRDPGFEPAADPAFEPAFEPVREAVGVAKVEINGNKYLKQVIAKVSFTINIHKA